MIAGAFGFPIELGHIAIACGAIAAAIVARAWWQTREPAAVRRARMPDGRPWRAWRAVARVGEAQIQLLEQLRANDGELPLHDLLADLEIDWSPPRAGPEVELRWHVLASSAEHAERYARRRLERLHLEPWALRVEPRSTKPDRIRTPA